MEEYIFITVEKKPPEYRNVLVWRCLCAWRLFKTDLMLMLCDRALAVCALLSVWRCALVGWYPLDPQPIPVGGVAVQ